MSAEHRCRRWLLLVLALGPLLTLGVVWAGAAQARHSLLSCDDLSLPNGGPYRITTRAVPCRAAARVARYAHSRCAGRCAAHGFRCRPGLVGGNVRFRCRSGHRLVSFVESGALLPAGAPIGCRPRGAHVVAEDAVAEVFTLERYAQDRADIAVYPALFRCLFSAGRAHPLLPSGDFPDEDAHYLVHVSGRFVAYGVVLAAGASASDPLLYVQDVGTGATVHEWDLQAGNGFHFTAIVLAGSGSVAWINELSGGSYEVRAAGPSAGVSGSALLDSGKSISPTSLTLAGNTVAWTDAGQPRSAQLG